MKKLIAVILVFLLISMPAVAVGQDTITRFRLPAGHRCTESGQTYQCFDLGEYTELLHMDVDLHDLTDSHAADIVRVAALTGESSELHLALTDAAAQVTLLGTERTRLTTLWQDADRQLREAQNRPDWSWIPWSLAAAFAVTTLVLGLIVGLQR